MELSQYGLMDHELIMAPKEELIMSSNTFNDQFLPNPWNLINNNPFYQTQDFHYFPPSNPAFLDLISPEEYKQYACPFSEFQPLDDALTSPEFGSFNEPLMSSHEEFASNVENFDLFDGVIGCEDGIMSGYCNVDQTSAPFDTLPNMGGLGNVGAYEERRSKSKKPEGQPSKNLMAERRRRKRLNDRLSMLRSIVPKISKMDRTAILGDTIDYMKELLDKIQKLKEEGLDENQITFIGNYLKELKPNEVLVRNPPKFDVERRKDDTRVEVYCTPKPGLLLSTLGTLDALSLDIQHCVISCFNDFSLQASCYEVPANQPIVSSEDIKQALFRNAGYAGRCL